MSSPDEYVTIVYADGERVTFCAIVDGSGRMASNSRDDKRARELLLPIAKLAKANGFEPLEGSFDGEKGALLKLDHEAVSLLPGMIEISKRVVENRERFNRARAEYDEANAAFADSLREILNGIKLP